MINYIGIGGVLLRRIQKHHIRLYPTVKRYARWRRCIIFHTQEFGSYRSHGHRIIFRSFYGLPKSLFHIQYKFIEIEREINVAVHAVVTILVKLDLCLAP